MTIQPKTIRENGKPFIALNGLQTLLDAVKAPKEMESWSTTSIPLLYRPAPTCPFLLKFWTQTPPGV